MDKGRKIKYIRDITSISLRNLMENDQTNFSNNRLSEAKLDFYIKKLDAIIDAAKDELGMDPDEK